MVLCIAFDKCSFMLQLLLVCCNSFLAFEWRPGRQVLVLKDMRLYAAIKEVTFIGQAWRMCFIPTAPASAVLFGYGGMLCPEDSAAAMQRSLHKLCHSVCWISSGHCATIGFKPHWWTETNWYLQYLFMVTYGTVQAFVSCLLQAITYDTPDTGMELNIV